ncbi:tyrosine-type recombinase/integrase, partial [Haemophilus quentini]
TMTRAGEASGARWDEIDFKKKIWVIPAERMKAREAHSIPLSIQAVILLKRLHAINGRFEYVFLKRGDNHAPMNPSSINMAIKRFGYHGRQTAHGFRGLARTWLGENGIPREIGEMCLSHRVGNAIEKAYNHANYLMQRKAVMQQWADFIEQCSAGTLPESHLKIVNS